MLTFKDYALLVHLFEANFAYGVFFLEFYLHFLGYKDEQETGEDLDRQFLHNVISLQQRISNADQDEIGTCEEEDEFIEKN